MKSSKSISTMAFILALSWPLMGQAAWTTVGSTGIVDEADLSNFNIDNSAPAVMQFKGIMAGTLNTRYNVVGDSLLEGGPGVYFGMRYWDTGLGARVILRLKQYNYGTGTTKTVLKLDSEDVEPPGFPYSSGERTTRIIGNCYGGIIPNEGLFYFNFSENAYFIDAEITRMVSQLDVYGQPVKAGLAMIKIEMIPCP